MRTGKNGIRRITAMVCALALCASMLPTAVFAEGTPDVDEAIQPATAVSQTDETDLKDTTGAIQTDGTEKDTATTDGDTTNPTNDTEETEKVDGSEDADGTDVVDGAEGEDTVLDQEQPRSPENDTEEANTEDKEEHEASSQEGVAESDQLQKAPALDLSQSETALYNADGDSRKIVDGQGEFYADPENKIWLSTRDGTLGNDQTVTFIIQMDGEEKDRVTVQNLPIYSVRLDVNAVLYDDKAWSDDSGISVTRDDSGNNGGWLISNLNPAFVNEYTVTINFTERTLKDNDAIQITDGENVYGTFFWAKGSATSCDYSRTLTVYVNDGLAYQTTIQTPRSLGVNTYWFESNLAQYTSDVRVEPDLLDSVTMKDVRVYLTTKCACRNPTCTCSGGCTCSEGCGCLACKPTQQKDTIYTPYGTITYDSDSVGVKMNLKVRLYVNGQQEYESEKFTTTNGLSGSLGFSANESAGYYFLSQAASVNSYDIFVKKAGKTEWERNSSTWWPTDSRIVLMSDDSNDEYVLCIYLYTFNQFLTLDVTRLNGTDAYVDGYTISYTARDSKDGTEKVFTYPATSFAAGQPQIVPYGREVTLTAVCKPGYAVDVWRADRDGSDLLFYGENGGNGPKISPQEAYGNTVYFNEYGTTSSQLQLQITSVKEVNTPTDDDLKKLLKNAITVECATNTTSHNPLVTGLLGAKNTDYEVTQTGNAATVTITKTDLYVSKYNEKYPGHTLGENSDLTIGLVYENGAWALDPSNNTATVYVKCTVTPTIPDPTPDDLNKLGKIVNIECTNNSSHDPITSAVRGGKDKDYIITHEANSDEATVTILNTDPYVKSYKQGDGQGKDHTLDAGSDLVLGLVYVNGAWALDASNTATVYVTCAPIVITPANLVIYKGGEKEDGADSNVEIVNGETGKVLSNDGSLPEIGFYLQLSDDLNEQLRKLLGKNANDVLNLSEYITLSAKDSSGNSYSWELQKYGDTDNSASGDSNNYFIYKIVPAQDSNGVPLKVTFWDPVEKKYVGTDDFNVDSSLSKDYEMEIYGDRVDAGTLKAEITISGQPTFTVGVVGAEDPATLTVRYVNGDQIDVVTHSYDSIEAASEADDPKQDALHTAYMIRQDENGKAVDNFVINESNVQVNGEDVSLLFDDIVDSTSYEYEKTLTGKAVAAVISADNSLNGATLKTEAKYLDLVESGNGNAWVTTNSKVTVYWPYPEGTDASTKFYVAHFEDLDRNAGTGEMADELEKTPATMMKVEQDAYGIYFTTDSFSPYVLVWEESQGQVTPPDDGDDDDNNTNTNTTTNNNTQNTTVNVAANNSAAAPAAAAVAIPQTGDNSQPLVWIALVGISGAALAALAVFRRKRSDK